MDRKFLSEIERLEKKKAKIVEKQAEIQADYDEVEQEIRKWYSLKKEYEKLENKSNELLNNRRKNKKSE